MNIQLFFALIIWGIFASIMLAVIIGGILDLFKQVHKSPR